MTGTQLGPYKIVAPLGRGGMGEVYRAKDTRLDREVAIKVLPEHLAADPDALKRFEREAKAVAALSHPNILTIYDVGSETGVSYAVMELLEGETLRTVIGGKPVPWRKAVEIGTAVAEGLAAAHSKGIIHRDLKPENIFITSDDRVKILDFGLARYKPQLSQQELTGAATESKLTESGIVMGTVPYMSPEQVRGESVDARTDIFAFGCVLYEMLTGKRAFHRDTSAETISAILRDEPPELPDTIPAELSHIIAHCLYKNADKRFQTARDLVFALRNLPSGSGWRAFRPGGRATKIATAVIALIAIAVLIVALRKQPPSLQETAGPKIQSLAVLPLKNLSGDPKQEYFSDSMTEEMITTLSRIQALRVISRSSVMEYKNANKPVSEIAKELRVDAVIDGSVLQVGNRVRISAQLIDPATDQNIWAESYERDLRDILALQNEVARTIAQQIKITIAPEDQARLARAPKVDPDAFQAYLRGREYVKSVDVSEDDLRLGIATFERAVELDPGLALAYAGLSLAHSRMFSHYDRTKDRLQKAKAAVDRAFEIQPGLPEGHIALGYYYYRGFRDYDRALQELGIAQRSLPNDVLVINGFALVRKRQGNFPAAIERWKKLLELSPRDAQPPLEMAISYMMMRQYSEADRYFDLSISFALPDQVYSYFYKSLNYRLWKGETKSGKQILERTPRKDNPIYTELSLQSETDQRNYPAVLTQLSSTTHEFFTAYGFRPKTLLAGLTYRFMNKTEMARFSFEAARKFLEQKLKDQPDDPRIHSSLGLAYAGLGRKDDAIREGRLAVDLLPVSKDASGGPFLLIDLAWIYTMVGEYDAAFDRIEYLLSIPSSVSVPLLKLEPRWDPLRNHPRFQDLLEKYDTGGVK